ncbi:WhiB family transcriptional regulator [Streptomyces liangshanensis]|uniref:WhiB family transcriptional regulator n=1 Tax=Streptomyces liangshanensis TaxID=2717324 RepID=UPI0036DE0FAB
MTTATSSLGRYAWHAAGLCQSDPDDFFGQNGGSADSARRICTDCPIRLACLEQAMVAESGLSYSMRAGIWGGLAPRERAARDRVRVDVAKLADPKPPKSKPVQKQSRGGGRPLAPCGTKAAYERHQRRGEDVDVACREWREEYLAARRRQPAQCGTSGGRSRHQRRGEPVCPDCRAAHKRAERRRLAKKTAGPSTRS